MERPIDVHYYARQRTRIEDALEHAHGVQGAPDCCPFMNLFLDRLDRQYRLRREEIIRNYSCQQRRAVLDQFEWVDPASDATDEDAGTAGADTTPGDLFCDGRRTFNLPLGTVGAKRVCVDCYEAHGYEVQTPLADS